MTWRKCESWNQHFWLMANRMLKSAKSSRWKNSQQIMDCKSSCRQRQTAAQHVFTRSRWFEWVNHDDGKREQFKHHHIRCMLIGHRIEMHPCTSHRLKQRTKHWIFGMIKLKCGKSFRNSLQLLDWLWFKHCSWVNNNLKSWHGQFPFVLVSDSNHQLFCVTIDCHRAKFLLAKTKAPSVCKGRKRLMLWVGVMRVFLWDFALWFPCIPCRCNILFCAQFTHCLLLESTLVLKHHSMDFRF